MCFFDIIVFFFFVSSLGFFFFFLFFFFPFSFFKFPLFNPFLSVEREREGESGLEKRGRGKVVMFYG